MRTRERAQGTTAPQDGWPGTVERGLLAGACVHRSRTGLADLHLKQERLAFKPASVVTLADQKQVASLDRACRLRSVRLNLERIAVDERGSDRHSIAGMNVLDRLAQLGSEVLRDEPVETLDPADLARAACSFRSGGGCVVEQTFEYHLERALERGRQAHGRPSPIALSTGRDLHVNRLWDALTPLNCREHFVPARTTAGLVGFENSIPGSASSGRRETSAP